MDPIVFQALITQQKHIDAVHSRFWIMLDFVAS